jgi:HEAT repeat protein
MLQHEGDPQGIVEPVKAIMPLQDKLRQSLDADPENAVLAADVLARVGDAGARRVLIHLVESSDGEVLAKAALACPRDDAELGTTLLPLAFEDGLLARRAVMMALVLKPNPWLKKIPLEGIHDLDPVIRRNAIRALGNLDGAAPVEELAAMLTGPGTDRADVIQALGAMGQRGADVLRRYVRDGSPPLGLEIVALVALAPHATRDDIPWVSEKLKSNNKHMRTATLNILGQIGNPAAQAAIMPLAKDPEDEVRASSAKALGQLTTVYASMKLVRMMNDPSPKVRSMAARGLGKANYAEAVPALKKLAFARAVTAEPLDRLDNVYGRPELAAVEALGRIATPEAVAALLELTKSRSWLTRAMAAHALGATGNHTPPVAQALEKLLKDPVNLVRAEAGISLATLGTPVAE